MLTSPRTVREISRSSILAEQGRLIVFPNVPPERSVERLTLRGTWLPRTRFRLRRVFSSLGVCLRRKSQNRGAYCPSRHHSEWDGGAGLRPNNPNVDWHHQ